MVIFCFQKVVCKTSLLTYDLHKRKSRVWVGIWTQAKVVQRHLLSYSAADRPLRKYSSGHNLVQALIHKTAGARLLSYELRHFMQWWHWHYDTMTMWWRGSMTVWELESTARQQDRWADEFLVSPVCDSCQSDRLHCFKSGVALRLRRHVAVSTQQS